jgi:hypothetical protein
MRNYEDISSDIHRLIDENGDVFNRYVMLSTELLNLGDRALFLRAIDKDHNLKVLRIDKFSV